MNHSRSNRPVRWVDCFVRYVRVSRPVGIGLVIYMLLNVTIASILVLSAPVGAYSEIRFERIPERYVSALGEADAPTPLSTDRYPGCALLPADDAGLRADAVDDQHDGSALVRCDEEAARNGLKDGPGEEYPLHLLAKRFESDPDWAVADHFVRVFSLPPGPAAIAWAALLVVPVSLLLVGRLDWAADARCGLRTIATRPWLLLAVPVVGVSTFQLFNLIMPFRIETATQAAELFRAAVPSAWLTVFLIPLAEEAVFRQWIYVRVIDRLPVWAAAIGTSWVFMLAHVFNPQVAAMPAYLPTMFALGLVLFWLRHRHGTLTLPLLAHISYNGLLVGLAG